MMSLNESLRMVTVTRFTVYCNVLSNRHIIFAPLKHMG